MKTDARPLALLVDSDFFAYQAAAACSRTVEWEDGVLEQWADLEEGKQIFKSSMESIKNFRKEFREAPLVMTWTAPDNWRKGIWADYKRARGSKPLAYWKLKEWVSQQYESFERPTLEGDDCMGILSTAPQLVNAKRTIIVSPDKDFNTIPGEFLWWDTFKGRHSFRKVSEDDANHWHMLQTLMGDVTDGYPGCPGMGEGTAREFLAEPYMVFQKERILKSGPRKGESEFQWSKRPLEPGEALWDAIVALFEKAGLAEADALVQAQVARICRSEDYNFKEKRVIPWTPKDKGGL